MPETPKSRFEMYKARHNGTLSKNEGCEIEAILDRFHDEFHGAMEDFDKTPDREQKWHEILCNAQRLVDDMPTKKVESVLTVFVFLSALDKHGTRSMPSWFTLMRRSTGAVDELLHPPRLVISCTRVW
jgi:hypothetical protein